MTTTGQKDKKTTNCFIFRMRWQKSSIEWIDYCKRFCLPISFDFNPCWFHDRWKFCNLRTYPSDPVLRSLLPSIEIQWPNEAMLF